MSALTPRLNRYIPYAPHVKQRAALLINLPDLLFGGAGGGGKSDFLLMAALQYADCKDYSATIFRRTYPMLKQPGGLIPRAQEWLEGTDAMGAEKYDGYFTRWDFPSGALLNFNHMQHFKDHTNQQGGEYQFVGIDEAGQFVRQMLTYMFSRLRRGADSKIPLRLRATANPGGDGMDFIMERYGIPARVVTDMIVHPDGQRAFLPSKLIDNPSIDRESYMTSLSMLDPVARAQIEYGDWSAREAGDMFQRHWFNVVGEAPPKPRKRIRFWDLAGTEVKPGTDPDWTVGTLMHMYGRGEERTWCVVDVQRFRKDPATTRKLVRQQSLIDGSGTLVGIEQEPGSAGKDSIQQFRKALAGRRVRAPRSTGSKKTRAATFASSAEAGTISVVRGSWTADWFAEMDAFPGGSATHDDQVDSVSGGYNESLKGSSFEDFYGDPVQEEVEEEVEAA